MNRKDSSLVCAKGQDYTCIQIPEVAMGNGEDGPTIRMTESEVAQALEKIEGPARVWGCVQAELGQEEVGKAAYTMVRRIAESPNGELALSPHTELGQAGLRKLIAQEFVIMGPRYDPQSRGQIAHLSDRLKRRLE